MALTDDKAELTQSAFAALMGTTSVTIMNYVLSGKICEPAIVRKPSGKVKHFVFGLAKRQFLDARAEIESKFGASQAAKLGVPNNRAQAAGKHKPKQAAAPTGGDIEQDDTPPETEPENEAQPGTGVDEHGLPTGTPGALRNRELQLKVRKAEIELAEKQGSLISRDAVYKALFVVGQEIRAAFESLPDRLIDSIIAAPNRPAAHSILSLEINDMLGRLSDMATMNLTTDRTPQAAKGTR